MDGLKRKALDLHGRGAEDCSDEPKSSSLEDLELAEREDLELAEREDQGINPAGIGSRERRDRSAYVVACHWDWLRSSRPYSVYKMSLSSRRKRLKRLGGLKSNAGSRVFTSVSSRNRAWIVGVGGVQGDTIIFDTIRKKVIQGPNLNSIKWNPLLATVGDKVYAMCKAPSWDSDPDFPPWFEELDLSKAKIAVTGAGRLHLEDCSWTPLPHPPCLPWKLSPTEYISMPIVFLTSCVVVGPYILVSFNRGWGTYAFDTNAQESHRQWHKVDKNRLPFVGCATPLGSIFLALSQEDGPIKAYRICVAASDDGKDDALKLSVTTLPVKYMGKGVDPGSCFSSLNNESFCSLSLSLDSHNLTYKPESGECFPHKMHVNLTTYQIENPSLLENGEEIMLAMNPEVAVSSQEERTLNIASTSHGFASSGFSLLSI